MKKNLSILIISVIFMSCAQEAKKPVVNTPSKVIQEYFNSTWDKRKNMILKDDEAYKYFTKWMEEYPNIYRTNIISIKDVSTGQDTLMYDIKTDRFDDAGFCDYRFYLIKKNSDYLIDWKRSFGYNEPTWKALIVIPAKETTVMKATIKLEASYIPEFHKIDIKDPLDRYTYIEGVMYKTDPDAKELLELLKDGEPHRATIWVQNVGGSSFYVNKCSPEW